MTLPDPDSDPNAGASPVRLYGWRDPAIVAAGWFALAAGFAQFGATAALGDVARTFGADQSGASIAAKVGLSGTTLGIGLAIIRLASLGSLPLAGLADRFGRKLTLLGCVALGLVLTAVAALSPTFWWFVAIFALGRPLLSATNTIAGVIVAEETTSRDRAKAIALVTAGFGIGAGLTALLRGAFGDQLGFRGLFALALVPLAVSPLIAPRLKEPERYRRLRAGVATVAAGASSRARRSGVRWLAGLMRADRRRNLWLLTALTFMFSFTTGPTNTFLFVYAENALGMSRRATALMVLAAGPLGLLGLVVGRWAADNLGRRRSAATSQALVALAGMVTYSGSPARAIGGYLLAIVAAAAYGPATATLVAELFPTSVRASVAGWLVAAGVLGAVAGLLAFGTISDALDSFGVAAVIICAPVVVSSVLFAPLPETLGLELEESAPE